MAKIQWDEELPQVTKIKVIGVGGGGCNAVDDMVSKGFSGVEFFAVNTDFQALNKSKVANKIQIGEAITHGLGTGAIPEIGEQAARAEEETIRGLLEGADMVFITAGMGGGTGTGAAPVIAEIARSMDILCVSIVTKPFCFEGPQRMRRAIQGIKRLKDHVDTMIVIMNDKLMETVGPKTPLTEAFQVVNSVLAQGIRAISDLISMPGLINVDFADVRTIMGETGGAVMGVGIGKGENRATEAVRKACHSPLQEKIVIDGARGILINITGGPDITMHEINEATSLVYESADPEANIIFGVVIDEGMTDEMRVTIIATGFNETPDSAEPFSLMGNQKIKSRTTNIFDSPLPAASHSLDDHPASSIREPDPEPAINRKREREASASDLKVDFGSPDNPMSKWPSPAPAASSNEPSPVAHEPATPLNTQTPSYQPQQSPQAPPQAPVTPPPTFQESQDTANETPSNENDPYEDEPALIRRRKQRFFE